MAGYSARSLATLSDEARAYFTQSIPGTIARVWANTFTVIGKVLALAGFEHEQRRAYLYDQVFASRAARLWLIRHGFELGLTLEPAAAASGTILVPAIAGLAVPGGLQFTRADGATYTTLAAESADGALVALSVEADATGALGNCDPGQPLTLVAGQTVPAGLGARAVVDDAGLAGGADAEEVETFRARVLERKRRPPQGGNAGDYATWATEALGPGVLRRAYVESFANDARSVWLCFTVEDQPQGLPTAEQVALVQAYCDDPIRRPITARIFATGPTPRAVDVAIARLSPDNLDVRDAVEAELAAVFADRAEVSTAQVPAVFYRAWLDEAISRAVGEDAHELASPTASLSLGPGELPVLGAVTYPT